MVKTTAIMESARAIDDFAHWPLEQWPQELPPGALHAIYLHWSAGTYEQVFESYHFCVAMRAGEVVVVQTNDLRANMRDVYLHLEEPYAAHTARRNSYAAGLSIMGMQNARPDDFGPYPITQPLIEGLCRVAAAIARAYDIPVISSHILTHAEAAVADGYFGTELEDERWDIARLYANPHPLEAEEAHATGDILRQRIRHFAGLPD